jgi:hypothetical protein
MVSQTDTHLVSFCWVDVRAEARTLQLCGAVLGPAEVVPFYKTAEASAMGELAPNYALTDLLCLG